MKAKKPCNFIELYMQKGSNPNAQNNDGETPLHKAALIGDIASAHYLKKNRAKIDILTKNRNTPAHYAMMNNHVDCSLSLLDNKIIDVQNDDHKTVVHDEMEK